MGPGRKMELPYRRYSVPETVMRKYWMSREKANSKNMVDKSAQTEWRPCVVWTEATSNGSVGRSASEPWLQGPVELRSINCRPATAPSTPSWSSTTVPPATTSAPTTSTSTSLRSTDPTRSPRPPPNVQVLCFHHGVSKTDVKIQFPEPSESSTSEGTPSYAEVGVNTDTTPPPSPIPEETSQDVAVQTGSRPTTSSEDSLPNSKICQTNFSASPPPTTLPIPAVSKRVDFTCQTEGSLAKEKIENQESSIISNQSQEQINKEASCSTGNYEEYPGAEMIIPRYSAVPRTGSMVVNIPSMDNSDSDLSLTDSLEDPCEDFISEWPENKLDNRLVRGEVSQIPVTSNRSYIRSKNTCAYFLFLSGEEGSIKEYKVPHKLETRLRRREEEIKKMYDLKYRKFPQITYRKKRRVQPIVLREMESQTNITKGIVNVNAETSKKKFVTSKSFDSCECNTNRKEQENIVSIKKLDRSKTISSFNIDSDQERNTGKIAVPNEDSSKSESSEEKTPRISLTLTVPSRSKRKDEESIDEKVARILIESLEEIRSQQHNVHAKISEKNKSDTTELSQHFIRKARALTKSIPGTSKPGPSENVSKANYVRDDNYGAIKWEDLRKKDLEEVMPALRSCQHPNIKYEEVRSRTRMREPLENEIYQHENIAETFPQSYLKVVKERRQYERTCSHSEEDVSESKKGTSIEDEELLRAVLKKSMQPKGAPISSSSNAGEAKLKQDGHSDVCELGLKFLSNEIDIDQFIAGIPLERIEQDVKKLMYKHYLGTNPETKESDSAYETLMKKKMVVSFVDKEKKLPDKKSQALHQKTGKQSYRCCVRCGAAVHSQLREEEQKNIKTSEYDRLVSLGGPSEVRGSYVCCHHCLTKDSEIYHLSDDEPEKLEKSVSPLDKSVATAVQTIDSFLDSGRLPVVNEISDSKFESILSSVKHNDHCKYNGNKSEIGCSKFCSCKNTNQGSTVDTHKNINTPNNHSPLNKSYYSPRPVKSCIKNNFEQKIGQRSDVEGQQIGSRKMPTKDTKVSKVLASKRSKNEINVASKDHTPHPKEPLEVKVVDNKGNILSRGVRNVPNRSEKKTTKLGVSKKSANPASKYTQMFEMIPEERNTPDYMEDCEHKLIEPRRKIKNQNMTPFGLPKQQSSKSHSMSTNTEQSDYANSTKKFVSKAVETISQKSVSTMVNFEQMGREDSRRSEMVKKDKSSKHYQPKTKPATGKSDRDIYIDDIKQQGDGKKDVVVGKYRPVQNKSELETHSVAKTKQGRPSIRQEASEDMLSLSKGWINFYLVRDNKDLTEFPEKDNNRTYNGCDEEQHAYSRRNLQKGTQTLEKQVQLPNLSLSQSRKCYKSSSDCSNISLPEIRSSSSSGPSSPENVPRSQFFRKPSEQLPQLGNEAFVKKKKKHHFYSSGEQSNKSDSGFSRDGERTTRRVEVSRSEHSISSVTSSSIVLSGSPKGGRDQDRNQRKSKSITSVPQSGAGSCWTVTVAGSGGTGNQPPPDVEMRLSFAGQRDEGSPRPQVLCSTQATNLAVKSSKRHEIEEEKADSDTSLHYSSGDPLSSITMSKRVGAGRNQNSRMSYEHEDYRQLKSRKCESEDEWECERGGVLHVTGSAITPEEKPRVPTQSERDLV